MATYTYTAREINTGKERKGLVEASASSAAVVLLRNQNLIVTALVEKKDTKWDPNNMFKKYFGISAKDIFTFTREFSTMIASGLPVTQALRILASQTGSKYFKEILESVVRDVEGGSSLSKAFEKYPAIFGTIYLSLVRSGEVSGSLDKSMERLTANLEKSREFKGKIKGALIYPVVILIMMVAVMVVMLIFVIPKLTEMYSSMGVDLPLSTKIMIGMSNFLVADWWLVIIILVGLFFGIRYFKKTAVGKKLTSDLTFRIPVFGQLLKLSQIAEFTRNLGILVGSGIPIIDALKVSKESLQNDSLRLTIDKAISSVGRGQPLSQLIASDPNFPLLVSQMIQVGEETGRLDKVLGDVAAYFESESDFAVKNLSAALEPLIMVVLGAGVGLMIISIITPIYKITTSF